MASDDRDSIQNIEDIELGLVLEAIYRRYGYDFRHYARASLERRLLQRVADEGMERLLDLLPPLLDDHRFAERVLDDLSIKVTEMFRDPPFYRALRDKIIPLLKTYPYIKIWHAGCSTGEEVYSMAILLHEEGYLHRAQIYATDLNKRALAAARAGIYSIDNIRTATHNYNQTNPKSTFNEYYSVKYDAAIINNNIREGIIFSHHNLASDGVFGEMNLILCRNVMIYFDSTLQNRVLRLFRDSLCHRGFLALGMKETLDFSDVAQAFNPVCPEARIYRLR